jgi:hypothetical protein
MLSHWLHRTSNDLRCLVEYLITMHGYPRAFQKLVAVHDSAHDEENARDPRAFCYVKEDHWEIYCASALEDVSPEVRVGILLHEIAHLKIPAFKGAASEIDVDSYILENFPEAGYVYADHMYWSRMRNKEVTAKSIEHVADTFVKLIRC